MAEEETDRDTDQEKFGWADERQALEESSVPKKWTAFFFSFLFFLSLYCSSALNSI